MALPAMLKAKKAPLEKVTLEALGLGGGAGGTALSRQLRRAASAAAAMPAALVLGLHSCAVA